jgi:hypothetical protein
MSSDSEVEIKKQKKGTKVAKDESYSIKPSKGGATLDTSSWPLLLKVSPTLFDLIVYRIMIH